MILLWFNINAVSGKSSGKGKVRSVFMKNQDFYCLIDNYSLKFLKKRVSFCDSFSFLNK